MILKIVLGIFIFSMLSSWAGTIMLGLANLDYLEAQMDAAFEEAFQTPGPKVRTRTKSLYIPKWYIFIPLFNTCLTFVMIFRWDDIISKARKGIDRMIRDTVNQVHEKKLKEELIAQMGDK